MQGIVRADPQVSAAQGLQTVRGVMQVSLMLKQVITAAAVVAAAATVVAQVPSQQVPEEQLRARQRIASMEAVLERAVSNGAGSVLRQVQTVMPDQPMLAGAPQARGFRLDGYGVFFDVEVPLLRLPILWPLRASVVRDNRDAVRTVQQIQAAIRSLDSAADRVQLETMLRRLEFELGAGDAGTRGRISAANVLPGAPVAQPSTVNSDVVNNPEDAYTREVKSALIDAMIENSLPLMLGPDEWLTVAARDNAPRDPLIPGDIVDFSTWVFRVKGSVLEAFRTGRITLEEAKKQVEQREY
jgi:hypothetical protein